MELNLNGESYEVASVGGLRYHLPKISDTRFAEVWLYSDSSWPAICALVNGGAAWLMFLRREGDSGFSTRNPNFAGPKTLLLNISSRTASGMNTPPNGTSPHRRLCALSNILWKEEEMAPWLHWHQEGS